MKGGVILIFITDVSCKSERNSEFEKLKKTEKLIDAIRHEISWRMPSVELVIDEDNISFSFIMTDKDKILGSIDKTERLLKELRELLE